MKMDNNLEGNGVDNNAQQIRDRLSEVLEQYMNRSQNPSQIVDPPLSFSSNSTPSILQQVNRIVTEGTIVDGIDAASPLGRSLQNKFTELEEISRRLKTRLNQVVCDSDILLSPDVEQNTVDLDLERDLNTDSQAEDLTPQEFYQLVQSHLPNTSECPSSDNSDKSDVSK